MPARSITVTRNGNGYKRYEDTPTGISPRALPGTRGTIYVSASDEHNEKGEVISDVFTDPPTRKKMMEKRMRKMELARKELAQIFLPKLEGSPDAEVTLVGWGSTVNLLRALCRRLEEEGVRVNFLLIKVVAPFLSDETTAILSRCKRLVMIEANFTSQMSRLLRMETGIGIKDRILKYDGEPFTASETYDQLNKILASKPAREAFAR